MSDAAEPTAAPTTLRLNAVIVSVVGTTPQVLTVPHPGSDEAALPYGLLRDDDRTLTPVGRRLARLGWAISGCSMMPPGPWVITIAPSGRRPCRFSHARKSSVRTW